MNVRAIRTAVDGKARRTTLLIHFERVASSTRNRPTINTLFRPAASAPRRTGSLSAPRPGVPPPPPRSAAPTIGIWSRARAAGMLQGGQRILDFRRDHRVNLPLDEAVVLEVPQGLDEHLLGNPLQLPPELPVPLRLALERHDHEGTPPARDDLENLPGGAPGVQHVVRVGVRYC